MALLEIAYISPFIGRIDDEGRDGLDVLDTIVQSFILHGYTTKVLAASIRSPLQFETSFRIGADAATIPVHVLEKLIVQEGTDKGIEKFLSDWKHYTKDIFP